MAGWGQLGVASLGFLGGVGGVGRGLLGMTKGLTGGAVRCWLGVAILVVLQVEASEANQVLFIQCHEQHFHLNSFLISKWNYSLGKITCTSWEVGEV